MVRYTVYFSGHVQGVGFRYTTQNIARGYAVSGYVRNLSDGRVELVAEGRKTELDHLLDAVNDRLGQYIRKRTVDQSPATLQYGQPGSVPLGIEY